jgi:hypothetical protein
LNRRRSRDAASKQPLTKRIAIRKEEEWLVRVLVDDEESAGYREPSSLLLNGIQGNRGGDIFSEPMSPLSSSLSTSHDDPRRRQQRNSFESFSRLDAGQQSRQASSSVPPSAGAATSRKTVEIAGGGTGDSGLLNGLEDDVIRNGSSTKHADWLARRGGVRVDWLLAFCFDLDLWEWSTWEVSDFRSESIL